MNQELLNPIVYLGYALVGTAVLFFFNFLIKLLDPKFRAQLNSEDLEYDPNRPRIKDSLGGLIISHTVMPDTRIGIEDWWKNIKDMNNEFYFQENGEYVKPGKKKKLDNELFVRK